MPDNKSQVNKNNVRRPITRAEINSLVNYLDGKSELVKRVAGISSEYKISVYSLERLKELSQVTKSPIRETAEGWAVFYRGCRFEWLSPRCRVS